MLASLLWGIFDTVVTEEKTRMVVLLWLLDGTRSDVGGLRAQNRLAEGQLSAWNVV